MGRFWIDSEDGANRTCQCLDICPLDAPVTQRLGNIIFLFEKYLFTWLRRVLVAACGLLSCGMQTLTCGMRVGSSSLTRDEPRLPALGAQSLNHWTTREVPGNIIFKLFFIFGHVVAACEILVPQTGIEPRPPAVEARIPKHWTTREFPGNTNINRNSQNLTQEPHVWGLTTAFMFLLVDCGDP